jgi:MipA family protein
VPRFQSRLNWCARLALAAIGLAATGANADQLPLWEAGAGIGIFNLAQYRGSNQYKTWVLPVPYVLYRGDILKVDERRMRGSFFRSDRVEVDLSLYGSPPVKDNNARQGMPDLDATVEIGPALNGKLYRSDDHKTGLELRLPVRGVIATDLSHFEYVGLVFQPNLSLDLHDPAGFKDWNLGLFASLVYTDRSYNRFFYQVDPVFATAGRPAYSPGGGYAGTQYIAALSRRYQRFWVGGFAKWDSMGGAAFAGSPLVTAQNNFSYGIAVAWVFDESKTKVEADR